MMKKLFAIPLFIGIGVVRAEQDVFDVDGSQFPEANFYFGNTTENPALLFERSLTGFGGPEKRQQCLSGWGTCTGGVTCGCPLTWKCCGTICKSVEDTCCSGYICPSGWGCCGVGKCYPYGGDCCSNGGYCNSGEYCIRLNGDAASIRCSIIGATSQVAATYATLTVPTTTAAVIATTSLNPVPTTITSTPPQSIYTVQSWYTRTFTLYFYIYAITTTTYTFTYNPTSTSTSLYTHVSYDYTSSPTVLSCQATVSSAALSSLTASAILIQSSVSSSAEQVGSQLSASLSAATRTATSSTRTSSTARSTAVGATATVTVTAGSSGATSQAPSRTGSGLVWLGAGSLLILGLMIGL